MVKHLPKKDEPEGDTILVGIDGSPQSFGALQTALELAKRFDKKVEIIGVYDPYLHYSVFHGIVGVLSEKASKVFRFEEQNQLHEEIIDTGLAQIYQSHLDVAERMALDAGTIVTKTLLDGKAFQKILDHVRKTNPWLVVVGRIGVHSAADETGLGSNTENLLRRCPCDILLSTRARLSRHRRARRGEHQVDARGGGAHDCACRRRSRASRAPASCAWRWRRATA